MIDAAGDIDRQDLLVADVSVVGRGRRARRPLPAGDRQDSRRGGRSCSTPHLLHAEDRPGAWREVSLRSAPRISCADAKDAGDCAGVPIHLGERGTGQHRPSGALLCALSRAAALRPPRHRPPNGPGAPDPPTASHRLPSSTCSPARRACHGSYELSSERKAVMPVARTRTSGSDASRRPATSHGCLENLDFIHGDRVVWTDYRRHRGGGRHLPGEAVLGRWPGGHHRSFQRRRLRSWLLTSGWAGLRPRLPEHLGPRSAQARSSAAFSKFNRARIEAPRCASIKNDIVASDEPYFAVDGGQVSYQRARASSRSL